MEYDHDNIAENHGKPQVAFMVNTDREVSTKHFNKDQYEEAVYGPGRWTTPLNSDSDKTAENIMPLSDIIAKIRHDFGINITVGHIRKKTTAGQYNLRDHGVRTRVANNLPTIAHELGHHLDNKYGMIPRKANKLPAALINELEDCLGQKAADYSNLILRSIETA